MYLSTPSPSKQVIIPPFWNPARHSMHRRARFHDYSSPGTYMLTLVAKYRQPLFGHLDVSGIPKVVLSELGQEIYDHELCKITHFYPDIHVWRHCIMPDHLHLIINVKSYLPGKRHLGHVVMGFKVGCNRALRRIAADDKATVFMENYNDRLLFDASHLDRWKKYLAENPKRLAIKRQSPRFFTSVRSLSVCGYHCEAFGNMFLLDIPAKMAVVVHTADSDEVFEQKRRQWLACGAAGGVLVSAAVAKREASVMREAMDCGYCVIYLRDNGFPDIYKPSGERFYACAEGRLLEMSPWPYQSQKRILTRPDCLYLNAMAEAIALHS